MKVSRDKQKLFVGLVVVLTGSTYTQFLFTTLRELWLVWGILVVLLFLLTSIATDWSDSGERSSTAAWLVAILALCGYTYWAYTAPVVPQLFLTYTFMWWSALLSFGYVLTGWQQRKRYFVLAGVVSLVLVPLLAWPQLATYYPLLFGIGHSSALGYLWSKS